MSDLCTTQDLALTVEGREDIQAFLPAGTKLQPAPNGNFHFVVACKSWFIPAIGTASAQNVELRLTDQLATNKEIMKQTLAAILEPEHLAALIKGFDISKQELDDLAEAKS